MHERIAVFVAATAVVLSGVAFSICFHEQERPDGPPIVLERLGRGDRMLLHHDMKTYSYMPWERNIMSDEAAAEFLGRTPVLNAAWVTLERGNREWESGNRADAIATWRVVADRYQGTDAHFAALSHMGQAARLGGDSRGATIAFTSLVALRDPPTRAAQLSEFDDRNYKHDACIELSEISIESQNISTAVKYLQLALDVHGFSDMCGTAVLSKCGAIEERMKVLRQVIAEKRVIHLK